MNCFFFTINYLNFAVCISSLKKFLIFLNLLTQNKEKTMFVISQRTKRLWLLGVLILCFQSAQSATYYVSSTTGNDNNDGLSEATPWQSLTPVNETRLEDNSTILFKRGETFRGAISLTSSPKELHLALMAVVKNQF
jgi:hypothetical protein